MRAPSDYGMRFNYVRRSIRARFRGDINNNDPVLNFSRGRSFNYFAKLGT